MTSEDQGQPEQPQLSDAELQEINRQRFQQRVNRVLEVMTQQRIDWRGVPYITPEGRIAVRIVPVEMDHPPGGS